MVADLQIKPSCLQVNRAQIFFIIPKKQWAGFKKNKKSEKLNCMCCPLQPEASLSSSTDSWLD